MDGSTAATATRGDRLRVAHVGPDHTGRGGMAAVMREMASSQLGRHHDVQLIVTWREGQDGAARVATFLRGVLALVRWCRAPGLVHVHTAVRGSWLRKAVCVVIASMTGHATVLQVHAGGPDITAYWSALSPSRRRFVRWAFRRADRVLTVSEAGREALERTLGLRAADVIPNAVPASSFHVPPCAANGNGVGVLYLGGFEDPAKGGHVLLDAIPELAADGARVRLVLAGPGTPPGEHAAQLVRGDPTAAWVGWLDGPAKAQALAEAQVVVFPSLSEGLPVALLEAMAAGRAIVGTRAGGIPELVDDGLTGVLVDPGDPVALAAALREVAADGDRRAELGRRARTRVAALGPDAVYGRVERLYRELLAAA